MSEKEGGGGTRRERDIDTSQGDREGGGEREKQQKRGNERGRERDNECEEE